MITNIKVLMSRIKKQRQIIKKFRNSAAISLELAKPLGELEIQIDPQIHKLLRKGIIKNSGDDTFYLDERKLMGDRMNKTKWGMILLFLLLGFIFLYLIRNQA